MSLKFHHPVYIGFQVTIKHKNVIFDSFNIFDGLYFPSTMDEPRFVILNPFRTYRVSYLTLHLIHTSSDCDNRAKVRHSKPAFTNKVRYVDMFRKFPNADILTPRHALAIKALIL